MNKKMRTLINILTLVIMLFGMVSIFNMSGKVLNTAWNLAFLNDNIQFYNEATRKTDEMTQDVMEDIEERDNNFYHSDDIIVRGYSNLNIVLKIAVILVAILSYPLTAFIVALQLIKTIRVALKRKQHKKHSNVVSITNHKRKRAL